MLRCAREAHDGTYQCVEATVHSATAVRKQLVEAVRGSLSATGGDVISECAQTWAAIATTSARSVSLPGGQVSQPGSHELMPGKEGDDRPAPSGTLTR